VSVVDRWVDRVPYGGASCRHDGIRRAIKPALDIKEIREVRGPLLHTPHSRLQQCGDLAWTGTPFTGHRYRASMPRAGSAPMAGAA
jgi:hypothetical protein